MDCFNPHISRWLTDYVALSLYQEYQKTSAIDSVFNRDLLQGLIMAVDTQDETCNLEIQLIVLICRLVDGCQPDVKYSDDDGQAETSTLELLLEDLEQLLNYTSMELEHLDDFIEAIRTQAVLVCCRQGEFAYAKSVVRRLKTDAKSTKEKALLKHLDKVASSKDPNHTMLTTHPYSRLKDAAIKFLSPIVGQFGTPFLVKASQETEKRAEFPNCVTASTLKRISKHLHTPEGGDANGQTSPGSQCLPEWGTKEWNPDSDRLKNKHIYLERLEREGLYSGCEEETTTPVPTAELSETPVESEVEEGPSRKASKKGPTWNRVKLPDYTDSEDETSKEPLGSRIKFPSPPKRPRDLSPARPTLAPTLAQNSPKPGRSSPRSAEDSPRGSTGSKLRRLWSIEEEAELYRLVRRHGVGHWAAIRTDGTFDGRSNVHLKDKWRNMLKPGYAKQLDVLKEKYGSI